MIQHIIQPYNHRSSFVLSGKDGSKTLYTQDIRGKKGLRLFKFARIYLRNTYENQKTDDTGNSDPYVRLEIILNRTILKELEWEYPITPNQIINLNIYKYIRFVGFNHSKFESMLSKRTNLKRRIEYHLNKTGKSLKNLNEYPVYEIINILKKLRVPHYGFLLNYKHETNMLQESLSNLQGYDVGRIKKRRSLL